MKKLLLCMALCILTMIFTSCSVSYRFSQDMSDLDQIQMAIVDLKTEMGYHAGSPYSEKEVTVIKAIETDKKEDFLSDFKTVKCYQPNFGSRIDCISGKAIRITYPNGEIELITHYGTATVKEGKIHTQTITFDVDDFSKLLDNYS